MTPRRNIFRERIFGPRNLSDLRLKMRPWPFLIYGLYHVVCVLKNDKSVDFLQNIREIATVPLFGLRELILRSPLEFFGLELTKKI